MSLRGSRPSSIAVFAAAAVSLAFVTLRGQTAPPADSLNLRYANGIAAIAEDKVITVDDIRREVAPLIPEIQKQAHNEKEFNEQLESLQEDVVQKLIDR